MLDIPMNKAIVAVRSDTTIKDDCELCYFHNNCDDICCTSTKRKDGKRVFFRLVDYPAEVHHD